MNGYISKITSEMTPPPYDSRCRASTARSAQRVKEAILALMRGKFLELRKKCEVDGFEIR